MQRRPTRAERREQTRADLVDAAAQLFSTEGVAKVSVESVAEAAGYSRGAYHSNFENRDELLDAVVDAVVTDLGPELGRRTAEARGALDQLEAYIRTFVAYCAREPVRTRALVAVVSHRATTGGAAYDTMVDESLADLVTIFEQGSKTGEMRTFDPTLMARMLRRTLDGEASRIAGGAAAAPIADELVTTFVRATGADTGAETTEGS
ncbi:TetR family transcriptional regulator [Nocardioides albertanoniae]|uniref:TetR family transcriptional regulator n=1 Tax=Nocardioides albertanoniae TaxID=1175486 RepID=A0A543ADC5_9ACTN|nr:TetR/AcrR family transcriptional regulator [Nocardioides albertanoniae]TQL70581.1 TetR family transcriptional regulator [Nocardioides albertanoniae]